LRFAVKRSKQKAMEKSNLIYVRGLDLHACGSAYLLKANFTVHIINFADMTRKEKEEVLCDERRVLFP
jgi:hypothetical protein